MHIRAGAQVYLRCCYAMEFDETFRSSRYLLARKTVQITNKVRIIRYSLKAT